MSGRGGGVRQSQAESILSVESDVGLDLMTLRLGPELKPRAGRLTQTPSTPKCVHLKQQALHNLFCTVVWGALKVIFFFLLAKYLFLKA